MSPKTIYLVRHGETDFNTDPEPRVRGRIDIPLNEAGLRHARQAGEWLRKDKIEAIYYSRIKRAAQTAEAIRETHPDAKFIEEPLAIDISWGDWEGKTYTEAFGSADGGEYMRDPSRLEIPNGESFYSVLDRVKKLLHKILASPEESVCIVSHGAVLNLLACFVFEAPLRKFWTFYMGGCATCKLVMRDIDDYSVKYWNETQYLK